MNFGASELRRKWIDFFKEKGHLDVSNRSLIPNSSDKSLLFINSGVAALKEYFCGDIEPPSKRLVSCQKVIRTGDIESIGDSFRHHTYFEMLGNFSIGDYFKQEAIQWAWEFLTECIGLNKERLYVTVYIEDKEAFEEWSKLIEINRIIKGNKKTNFWDMGVGPCGPCTEIYFDKGEEFDPDNKGLELLINDLENERYLEIWNIVFSEYLNVDGKLSPAISKNIDTGAGLERLLSVLEGKSNNFETSLFFPIVEYIQSFSKLTGPKNWAISDYLRTVCLLLNDGVKFGSKGREYIVRKLFRKAISLLNCWNLDKDFFQNLTRRISDTLPYYLWNISEIVNCLLEEFLFFRRTMVFSQKLLEETLNKFEKNIPAEEIFNLVTSHGLDFWIVEKIIESKGKEFSRTRYEKLVQDHKALSFNSNISSAFTKKIPSLSNLKFNSIMNYEDSFLKSKIIAMFNENFELTDYISEKGYLILEETVVFPLSGGQESDLGFINGEKIEKSIKAPGGQILHLVSGSYKVGDVVEVFHDKDKRQQLEANHTLEHIFFELLKREIDPQIKRNSGLKKSDYFSLEIVVPTEINKESFNLIDLNNKLQEVIDSNLQITTSFIALEQARKLNIPFQFEEIYSKNKDNLRLVNIGDYSLELCSGTHVSQTKDIGECLIVEFKKKQSNIYKFKVVRGKELLSEILLGKTKEEFLSRNNPELERKIKEEKKNNFEIEKRKFLNILNDQTKKFIYIENEVVDLEIVTAAFREMKALLKKQIVLFYRLEKKGYRFFLASDFFDLSVLFKKFREELGWKCGGNSNFGSGMGNKENFKETVIKLLEEFFN